MNHPSMPIEITERTVFSRIKKKIYSKLNKSKEKPVKNDMALGIGLIGAGNVAKYLYLPALKNTFPFKLAAVFDLDENSARNIAHEYKTNDCTSLQSLLETPEVEAVFICTPPKTHPEIVSESLDANKHILCEKPFALTTSEAREMYEKSKNSNLVTMVNFNYRYSPPIEYARRIIQSGLLGRIYHLTGYLSQGQWFTKDHTPSSERMDASSWKYTQEGGLLFDLAPHLVDTTRYWLGEITSVQALSKTFQPGTDASDDVIGMTFTHENGAVSHMMTSRVVTGEKEHSMFEISGNLGSIRLVKHQLFLWTRSSPRWKELLIPEDCKKSFFIDFYQKIKGGEHAIPTFKEGLVNCRILEGIQVSNKKGCRIPLSDESSVLQNRGNEQPLIQKT